METVKLSSKGQIVIPKEIRDTHKLTPGTQFVISFVSGEIRLAPTPVFPRVRVEQGLGILQKKGHKPLSEADTARKIGKMLKASDKATKK
jgi:AbrB family looped-hinge helix DNA binding protein